MTSEISSTNQPTGFDPKQTQNSIRFRHNAKVQCDTLTSLENDSKNTKIKKQETFSSFIKQLIAEQYPSKLVEALEECTSRCGKSPILKLGYRNFESLKPEEMEQPVMGVTTYRGQIGIAIHICGGLEKYVNIILRIGHQPYVWLPDVNNVLIIFKDTISTTSTSWSWSYKWGLNDNLIIERIDYEERTSQKDNKVSKLEGMDKCSRDPHHFIDNILVDVLTGKGETTFVLESYETPSFLQSVVGFTKKKFFKIFNE